ncbi:hypothetical protein [Denitratimonas sp. CY0512]|uniref:hypothetical protein n=1 Tax=Denitratimonas sp. CY0512 TaxID=3131940 RepID=UPI0030998324
MSPRAGNAGIMTRIHAAAHSFCDFRLQAMAVSIETTVQPARLYAVRSIAVPDPNERHSR